MPSSQAPKPDEAESAISASSGFGTCADGLSLVDPQQDVRLRVDLGVGGKRIQADGFGHGDGIGESGVGVTVPVGIDHRLVIDGAVGEVQPHGQQLLVKAFFAFPRMPCILLVPEFI